MPANTMTPRDFADIAVVSIGALRLCVPVDQLRHALERPQDMSAIPRRDTPLLGIFSYRDKPVPLVDLARWVEIPPGMHAQTSDERVLILDDGERSIGVLIHAVEGVRRVPHTAIQRAHHASSDEEVFDSVVTIDGEATPLPLLDSSRLMALAQVWTGGQNEVASSPSQQIAAGETKAMHAERYAVLRIGSMLLGFKAIDLAELLPRPKVQALSIGTLSGICEWRSRPVPVTDLAVTLGQSTPSVAASWLAMLLADGLALAFPVNELKRIAAIKDIDIKAAPEHWHRTGFVIGQVQDESGEAIYLLDACSLIKHSPNAAISQMTTAKAAGSIMRQEERNTQPYLVFETGRRYCAPLEGIREIVALPIGEAEALQRPAATFPWRGIALEVCRIEGARGGEPETDTTAHHLLIVEQGAGWKAVLIGAVRRIVPTRGAVISKFSTANGQNVNFLTVGSDEDKESVSIVGLLDAA